VPDTSPDATTPDYYTPSKAIIYTKNTDENNTVKIDVFSVKVRRYLESGTAGNKATFSAVFGGSDSEHLAVSLKGGDEPPSG